MSKHIVIVGAGEIGLSLGRILKANDHSIKFWDKDPKVLEALGGEVLGLPGIVPKSDVLFLCVPSWALREALLCVSPYLSKHTLVVAVSKGIEVASLKTVDEVSTSILPKGQPFCLLSGTMIAEELREGNFGAGVAATKNSKFSNQISALFEGTNLLIVGSIDVKGVALCGVLKNIYAIFLGMTFGLELGENARGYLVSLALGEMKKILALLGGKQETALGVAGLGDLIATGFSQFSKNQQSGVALARGTILPHTEGLSSLSSLIILLEGKLSKFPLLKMIDAIVRGETDAGPEIDKLLAGKNI